MKPFSRMGFSVLACLCLAHDYCPAQGPAQAVHPKGTFIRPADGIQDPVLDNAWNEYRAAISGAVDALKAVMDQRLEVAKKKGVLADVERSQASLAMMDDQGILPGDKEMQSDVNKAGTAFRKANAKLLESYDEIVGTLTREGKVPAAKAARDERGGLEAGLAFPPIPNVPEPLFDGKIWIGWGQGWGEGSHKVIVEDKAVRLTGFKFFAHERVLDSDVTFEVEVRNRAFERRDGSVQFGIQTDDGACLVCIPARADNGHGPVLPGKAEVGHYDNIRKQSNVLSQFACPPPVGAQWHVCRFSRHGDRYSVIIDGKKVVNGQPLPEQIRHNFNLHIGARDGSADFRNLRLIRNVNFGNQ